MKAERPCRICQKPMRWSCKGEMHRACGRKGFRLDGTCLSCGAIVSPRSRGSHCSTKCGTKGPWNKGLTAETSDVLRRVGDTQRGVPKPSSSRAMSARWKDPAARRVLNESLSRGQKKRFTRPEEREANALRVKNAIEAGKMKAFGGRGHGNGRPITTSEREMSNRLGSIGFVIGYVVPTKKKRGEGFPTNYKIDLAHEAEKIAIEIDGTSHQGREEIDEKKTFFLESTGWSVFRFRVPFDFDEAARTVLEAM